LELPGRSIVKLTLCTSPRVDMLRRLHKPHVVVVNPETSLCLLAKNSMLLCYSFVQFFVRLLNDLDDDAECHYIYPASYVESSTCSDGRQRASLHVDGRGRLDVTSTSLTSLTHINTHGLDMRNVNAALGSLTICS